MELAVYDQDFVDVRDRLRRRRMTDCHSITGLSRRHEALRLFGRSREMSQRHGMGWRVHGRLASEVRNSTYGSLRENGASSSAGIQRFHLGIHSNIGLGSITRRESWLSRSFLHLECQRNEHQGRRDLHRSQLPLQDPRPLPRLKKRRRKQKKIEITLG
ncbi:zinc finger CCCH domain-containing protein 34-like [Prunus yedoensis var. nudiflora]|uniref:Zinc finger CCCH domain-containing protein 34-like n=1 Tax=Prunus yedoensis var. nudiflora TaxID=2094558 RepID=A0A314ZNN6_PRUYE|nr:zinc finger CCCH domain-containing protein 34-like [Prunus yedoensis var. nudiflora]